jgi:hypothetical protein
MIRSRTRQPDVTAPEPAGAVPETVHDDLAEPAEFPTPEPPAGDASAAQIAEIEEQYGHDGKAAAERAERDQAEYDARMDAVREKAARMIADEEAQARPLADTAAKASRAAGQFGETQKLLRTAADRATKAEAAEAAVRVLEAERDELIRRLDDLGQRRSERAAESRDLEAQLAAATEAAEADTVTNVRNKLESTRAIDAGLAGRQSAAQARLEEIGDGEMSPIWPQKALAEARRVAHGARSQAADTLNHALPGRAEAVAARERAHDRLIDRMLSERIADERQAAQRAQPRQIVHL